MQFVLPLEEEGRSQRHTTTLHVMLAFLLFGIGIAGIGMYLGFTVMSKNFITNGIYNSFLFFGIACLLASVALLLLSIFQKTWLRQKQNNLLFRIIELVLLAGSAVLFFMNGWKMPAILFGIMSAVVVFAIIREKRTAQAGNILIDHSGITLHGDVRTRKLEWKEVESVLLRFGILSIECTENRLIQRNIAANNIDVNTLSSYTNEQIEAAAKERVLNDW